MHSKSRFGRTMTEEELETVKQKIELAEKVINTKNQRPDINTDRNINYTNARTERSFRLYAKRSKGQVR